MRIFTLLLCLSSFTLSFSASADVMHGMGIGGGGAVGVAGVSAPTSSALFVPVRPSISVLGGIGGLTGLDGYEYLDIDLSSYLLAIAALTGADPLVAYADPASRNEPDLAIAPETLFNLRGISTFWDPLQSEHPFLKIGATAVLGAGALAVLQSANRDAQFKQYGATFLSAGVGPALSLTFIEDRLDLTSGLTFDVAGTTVPPNQIKFAGVGAIWTTDLWFAVVPDYFAIRAKAKWEYRFFPADSGGQRRENHSINNASIHVQAVVFPLAFFN